MKRYFCDSCKREVDTLNHLEVPCHLFSLRGKGAIAGYVDSDFNAVSRRMDVIELCNKCWNVAFEAALDAIKVKYEKKKA